jgi:peptide/nickel transport system permease protein
MKWYIIRRLLWTGVATFAVLTITFILITVAPNQAVQNAVIGAITDPATSAEQAAQAVQERRGLNRPLLTRYVDFMTAIVQGDWGWSFNYDRPVKAVILERIPYSLMYGLPAILISTVVGVAIGLYSAVNQYTKKDYAATFAAFFGVSIPNFWFGLVLIVIFASFLGWIPFEFQAAYAQNTARELVWLTEVNAAEHPAFLGSDVQGTRTVGILSWLNIKQLIAPTLVVLTGAIASVMRFARAEALEYVDAEFVKTAKAKGVSGWQITAKHIFRPAAIPLTTILVGRVLGLVLFGAYVTEVVFGIPGIGQASYQAIISSDSSLVMVTILIPTFLTIFGNLVEDLLYAVLDPRISFGDQ